VLRTFSDDPYAATGIDLFEKTIMVVMPTMASPGDASYMFMMFPNNRCQHTHATKDFKHKH
jgi:hypothetical protein